MTRTLVTRQIAQKSFCIVLFPRSGPKRAPEKLGASWCRVKRDTSAAGNDARWQLPAEISAVSRTRPPHALRLGMRRAVRERLAQQMDLIGMAEDVRMQRHV